MRLDKMTAKLQQALEDAINLATELNHQQVEPEHLLLVLIQQEENISKAQG